MKKTVVKFIILTSILISGCSLDIKTKHIVKSELKDCSIVVIENIFNITYVENHAIAFGFLENIPRGIRIPLIFLLTNLAALFGFYMIWKLRYRKMRLLVPFFIIIGGAYGNIIDRMLNGFVTDFFHVHYFYKYNFWVFNVADLLINIGVILIIFQWKDFREIFDEIFNKKPIKTNC